MTSFKIGLIFVDAVEDLSEIVLREREMDAKSSLDLVRFWLSTATSASSTSTIRKQMKTKMRNEKISEKGEKNCRLKKNKEVGSVVA